MILFGTLDGITVQTFFDHKQLVVIDSPFHLLWFAECHRNCTSVHHIIWLLDIIIYNSTSVFVR